MTRFAAAVALAALVFVDAHAQLASAGSTEIADAGSGKKHAKTAGKRLSLGDLWEQIEAADQAIAEADLEKASQMLDRVISAPAFAELDAERSRRTLSSAAEIAGKRADFARAHALYKRLSQSSSDTNDDWMGRLNAAWFIGDLDDAVSSLMEVAQRWPEELQYVSEWAIEALLLHARESLPHTEAPLLQALLDTDWQTDLGREPNALWMRLIELRLENGAVAEALDVSGRLRDPLAIVTIRSDLRFAPLLQAAPEWFDIDETIEAAIIEARLSVEAHPNLLAPAVSLAESLLRAGHAQDALLVIDTHMTRAALKTVAGEAFDDAVAETVRALTNKALALIALERWDEAASQLDLASRQAVSPERAGDLYAVALLQARLGLSDPAIETLRRVKRADDDPQADLVRFIVARTRGDEAGEARALRALLEAEGTAGAEVQHALLIAGNIDAAARVLIRRLNDPAQRTPALLELQGMREQRWPRAEADWKILTQALMSREDVRRSVAASGGIISEYAIYRWN